MIILKIIYLKNRKAIILFALTLLTFAPTLILQVNINENSNVNTEKQDNEIQLPRILSSNYIFYWEEQHNLHSWIDGDDILLFGPSYGAFHNYTEIIDKLTKLNQSFPEIIDFGFIGKSYYGRNIPFIRITNESNSNDKIQIIVIAQHHAREQITVENALYFIDSIVYNYSTSSSLGISVLNEKEIYVIPSLNVDGASVISQFSWQRKTLHPFDEDGDGFSDEFNETGLIFEPQDIDNDGYITAYAIEENDIKWTMIGFEGIDLDGDGKIGEDVPGGVDPNRNYPYNFANPVYSDFDPRSENFHGNKSLSENCTKHLVEFIKNHNFSIAVTLHSGLETIFTPSNVFTAPKREIDSVKYQDVVGNVSEIIGFDQTHTSTSSGQFIHWMYWDNDYSPIVMNIEVYLNWSAVSLEYNETTNVYSAKGIWSKNNPSEDGIITNCEKINKGLYYLTTVDNYYLNANNINELHKISKSDNDAPDNNTNTEPNNDNNNLKIPGFPVLNLIILISIITFILRKIKIPY